MMRSPAGRLAAAILLLILAAVSGATGARRVSSENSPPSDAAGDSGSFEHYLALASRAALSVCRDLLMLQYQ